MGKPYKLDTKRKKKLLNALKAGATRSAAAGASGISRTTFYEAIDRDDKLRNEVEEAELSVLKKVEGYLLKNCARGKEASIFFYLCNKDKTNWQHRQTIEQKIKIEEKREYEVTWGNRLLKPPKNGSRKSESTLISTLTKRSKPSNGATQDSRS